jgi:acetyl esterase/lipase
VVGSGAVAVYVDYTPSPEAQYPTAINQAYAATRWVAEHGKEIGVDGKRLAVAGNSVGGNMAAVVALMAKEQKTPALRFQLLMWPVTNASSTRLVPAICRGPLPDQGHDAVVLGQLHHQPGRTRADPRLAAQRQRRTAQGPARRAGADRRIRRLRDEGEGYARHLDAAGVPVTSVRYNGMIHDFGLLNPLSQIPEVKAAVRQAAAELKTHLN